MFRKLFPFLAGALVVTLAFGALAFPAFARSLSQTSTPQATTPQGTTPQRQAPAGRMPPGGQDDESLAKALNITTTQLQEARQKAYVAALDQAVKTGQLTQSQADQLKARSANGMGGKGGFGGWDVTGIDFDQLLADALGITKEKLQAAYQVANQARIDQAVTDGKLTQEQADLMKGEQALFANQNFQTAIQTAIQDAIKKAVSEGVITQAQADLILKNFSTQNFGFGMHGGRDGGMPGMPGMDGFRGEGGHGGRGGHGGFGMPNGAPNSAPQQAPSDSSSTNPGL